MILHTFNSPRALSQHSQMVANDDAVVLIENGVYGHCEGGKVYLLEADAKARGIATDNRGISYIEFVELCVAADKICNWF